MPKKSIFLCLEIVSCVLAAILLAGCAGSRPNIDIPSQRPSTELPITQPRVALVLGGGGVRGFAHIGVLKVLHEAGVPIDLMAGTSAGSIVGALYADQGNIVAVENTAKSAKLGDILDFNNLPQSDGVLKGYKLQKFLLEHMQAQTFDQLKIPLITVSTDLKTGAPVEIDNGPIAPAVQASAAIPGLFDPVSLYGYTLIDGGMSDPVAVNFVQAYHPKIIIAVDVAEQLPSTLPTTAEGIYNRAFIIMRLNMTSLSAENADVLILPDVGVTHIFDINKKDALIKAGEDAAKKALPEIKRLLKERGIKLNPPTKT